MSTHDHQAMNRESLRKDIVISFKFPDSQKMWYGKVIHIGLGNVAKNAVWVRVLGDGVNLGIQSVMLSDIVEVVQQWTR